jgi:hypothetical protein
MEALSPGSKPAGPIRESVNRPPRRLSAGDPGRAMGYSLPSTGVTATLRRAQRHRFAVTCRAGAPHREFFPKGGVKRSRNLIDAQGFERIWRSHDPHCSAGACDSCLLAPDFSSGVERSRNIIDAEELRDLSRGREAKKAKDWNPTTPRCPVTVTSGKVPVTPGVRSKIRLQAGMSKGMSHVRSYVPLQATGASGYRQIPNEKARKTEKHQWYPGMSKGMNRLAGYMACRDRDNWDFREILQRTGLGVWRYSCPRIVRSQSLRYAR